MVHSPDSLSLLQKMFLFFFFFFAVILLFCIAVVEQLGDDSWVISAACCHVALVFVIMHIYINTFVVFKLSFLSIPCLHYLKKIWYE